MCLSVFRPPLHIARCPSVEEKTIAGFCGKYFPTKSVAKKGVGPNRWVCSYFEFFLAEVDLERAHIRVTNAPG